MAFVAQPMSPGDLLESADRLAAAADRRLAGLPTVAGRQAAFPELWRQVCELGWHGVAIGEAEGGVGGGLAELAALAEGAGRRAFALPLVSQCAVLPALLRAAPSGAGRALLGEIANGRIVCPLDCGEAGEGGVQVLVSEAGVLLRGVVRGADYLPGAGAFLVAARLEPTDELALVVVPADAGNLVVSCFQRMDGRPAADLVFEAVRCPAEALIARGAGVRAASSRAREEATLLICVEVVAAMGALVEQTVTYLNERVQFDVPLSRFQVLRHKLVDMYVAYETTRALVLHVLQRSLVEPAIPQRALRLAKLRLSQAGRLVAETAIQLHGGMGMTDELAATRLARRILMAQFEYGDAIDHVARVRTMDAKREAA